jgi:hypothetical protein
MPPLISTRKPGGAQNLKSSGDSWFARYVIHGFRFWRISWDVVK